MRLAPLLPTVALCLAPFASAQSSDQDLRAAIRKIVREEIQAALKDMHQPMVVQGQPIAVPGLPSGTFHLTTKAKTGKKEAGGSAKAITIDDVTNRIKGMDVGGMDVGGMDVGGMDVVEGKPIRLELNRMLAGKLLEGKAMEGSTGNLQWKVIQAEGGEGEHQHEGGAHEVKKGMTFHAGPGVMVLQAEGGEGKDGQPNLIRLLKAHATTATEAAKAAAECCEAAKQAAECCEVAKQAESCCEATKEATKAAECCEGEKCAECVIEVAPVAKKAEKAEKAEKKAKKAGKKKAKKQKPVETEEIELKIG